jgi:hypothetical protein
MMISSVGFTAALIGMVGGGEEQQSNIAGFTATAELQELRQPPRYTNLNNVVLQLTNIA